MQLSGGQLPATARRSRTLIFLSKGKKNATNLAGTSSIRHPSTEGWRIFLSEITTLNFFRNIDGITDIILHYSVHTICYCVDEEVNYRKDDIIEEV